MCDSLELHIIAEFNCVKDYPLRLLMGTSRHQGFIGVGLGRKAIPASCKYFHD